MTRGLIHRENGRLGVTVVRVLLLVLVHYGGAVINGNPNCILTRSPPRVKLGKE